MDTVADKQPMGGGGAGSKPKKKVDSPAGNSSRLCHPAKSTKAKSPTYTNDSVISDASCCNGSCGNQRRLRQSCSPVRLCAPCTNAVCHRSCGSPQRNYPVQSDELLGKTSHFVKSRAPLAQKNGSIQSDLPGNNSACNGTCAFKRSFGLPGDPTKACAPCAACVNSLCNRTCCIHRSSCRKCDPAKYCAPCVNSCCNRTCGIQRCSHRPSCAVQSYACCGNSAYNGTCGFQRNWPRTCDPLHSCSPCRHAFYHRMCGCTRISLGTSDVERKAPNTSPVKSRQINSINTDSSRENAASVRTTTSSRSTDDGQTDSVTTGQSDGKGHRRLVKNETEPESSDYIDETNNITYTYKEISKHRYLFNVVPDSFDRRFVRVERPSIGTNEKRSKDRKTEILENQVRDKNQTHDRIIAAAALESVTEESLIRQSSEETVIKPDNTELDSKGSVAKPLEESESEVGKGKDQVFEPKILRQQPSEFKGFAATLSRKKSQGNGEEPQSSSSKDLLKEGKEEEDILSKEQIDFPKENDHTKSQSKESQNMVREDDEAYVEPILNQEELESELRSSPSNIALWNNNGQESESSRLADKKYEDKSPLLIKLISNSTCSTYTDSPGHVCSKFFPDYPLRQTKIINYEDHRENVVDEAIVSEPAEAEPKPEHKGEEKGQGTANTSWCNNSCCSGSPCNNSFEYCYTYYNPTRRMCRCNKYMTWPARSTCNGPRCCCNCCCSRNR